MEKTEVHFKEKYQINSKIITHKVMLCYIAGIGTKRAILRNEALNAKSKNYDRTQNVMVNNIPGLSRSSSLQDNDFEPKDGTQQCQNFEQKKIGVDDSTYTDTGIPSYQEAAHPNPQLYPKLD